MHYVALLAGVMFFYVSWKHFVPKHHGKRVSCVWFKNVQEQTMAAVMVKPSEAVEQPSKLPAAAAFSLPMGIV